MTQQTLSVEDKAFLEQLAAIDFGPIAFKLINGEDGESWTLEQATDAIAQYRKFLLLTYLYPDEQIVPSREVDQVWHTHILDTAKYRQDCEMLFGRFIDHWPYFGMTDNADRQALNGAFEKTQILFAKHFSTSNCADQ
jgi:hypothetical protein